MYTSQARMTGFSGFDVESMVTSIMKAESLKMDKLTQSKQLLQWKQQSYYDVSKSLKEFQNSFLNMMNPASNIRSESLFSTYNISSKVNGAASSAVTATSTGKTTAGSHTIDVRQLATADTYATSGSASSRISTNVSSVNVAQLKAGDGFKIALDNGTAKTISFTQEDIDALQSAKNTSDDALGAKMVEILNEKLAMFGKEGLDTNSPQKIEATYSSADGKLSIAPVSGHTITMTNNSTNGLGKLGLPENSTTKIKLDDKLYNLFNVSPAEQTLNINGKSIYLNAGATVNDLIKAVNGADAGVKMSFDEMNQSIVMKATETGYENAIVLNDSTKAFFESMGLAQTQTAKDAVVSIDGGADVTRASNSFEVHGMNVTLNATTEAGKPVTLAAESNTAPSLDAIKKFVEGYNSLIESLNSQYSNSRPKTDSRNYYTPLTSDQKANMTEKEIELWEEQAKTGMLYRDPAVSQILSDMRSMMYESVTLDNGKKISLYEIGITTSSNYRDGGKLIIDEEKLKKALSERPEDVMTLFTKSSEIPATDKANRRTRLKEEGIGERLNDIVNYSTNAESAIVQKAGVNATDTMSSMYAELKKLDTRIYDLNQYFIRRENSLYRQFAAMEEAMNKANAQLSSIQGLFAS